MLLASANCGIAIQTDQETPPVPAAKIDALILQLGDDDFQLRELAESELLNIGGPAIGSVRDAQASGNSEIRFRAYRLLPLLKRAEAEASFQEFIDLGVAQPFETFAPWTEFSRIVGRDKSARELYAAIHKASPQLFESLRSDPNLARVEYLQLVSKVIQSRFRSLNVAAILFLDTLDFGDPSDRTVSGGSNGPVQRIWTNAEALIRTGEYLGTRNAISFIESSGFENQFRSLIENWIDGLPGADNQVLETKLNLIEAYRLTDRLPALIEIASNRNESVQSRAKAVMIVANLGGPTNIYDLQPLLENASSVGHFVGNRDQQQLLEVQLRDVALAACVYLSGENPEDFGFEVNPHRKGDSISLSRSGFFSQLEREQAFQKWQDYLQDNPRRGN
jgi:hypothetical protein